MTKVLAPILLRSVSDLGLTGRVRCGLQSTTSKPTVSSSAPLALLWDSCLGPHLDIGWYLMSRTWDLTSPLTLVFL